jgi:ribosome modulation factor
MRKKPASRKKSPRAKSEILANAKNMAAGKTGIFGKPQKYEKAWLPPPGFFDDMPAPRGKHWPVPRNAEEMAATLEKLRLGRERAKARRQQEAAERAEQEAIARRATDPFGPGGQRRRKPDAPTQGREAQILEAIASGEWFGVPDIIAATGSPAGTVKALVAKMTKEGRLERAQNPDYDAGKAGGSQTEPQWLYRTPRERR